MSHASNNSVDEKATTRCSSKFTVIYTFRAAVASDTPESTLPLRQDIDMHVQLESIAEQRRNGCSQADWRVYVTTWATQETHEKFLLSLLGESRRYCRQHDLYRNRQQNIRSLLRRVDRDMSDPDADRYMNLTSEIAGYGLFHLPAKASPPPASPSYRHREVIGFGSAAHNACKKATPSVEMNPPQDASVQPATQNPVVA